MTNKQIDNRIKRLNELEAQAAEIKKQVDKIKDQLKEELVVQDKEAIDTGVHRIFWTSYTKNIVDNQKLKDAGLYNQYLKAQTVNQFKITNVAVI